MAFPVSPRTQAVDGLKLLVVGEVNVGKSAMCKRYTERVWIGTTRTTSGLDCSLRVTEINGRQVSLALWDIAGLERSLNMTRAYYQNAHGAIIVFDKSSAPTWEKVQLWLKDIREKVFHPDGKPLPVVLMAHKCDLPGSQMPEDSVIQEFITADGSITGCHDTSAVTGEGIDAAIQELVLRIWEIQSTAVAPTSAPAGPRVVLSSSHSQPRTSGCAC